MNQQSKQSCHSCSGCANHNTKDRKCGGSSCCGSCGCQNRAIEITEREKDFLQLLAQLPFLPLASFVSPGPAQQESALAPVYLNSADDSLDAVLEAGAALRSLEQKRLITLDYDQPLQNYDYSLYRESRAYQDFSKKQTGTPIIQSGSFALTSLGQEVLDSMEIFL